MVEEFEREGIVSDYCCFMDMDLQTITKDKMDFSSSYKINMKESIKVSGVISWFDCYFTHGKKQVLLSTSK